MKITRLLIALAFGLFCGIFGWQFGRHYGVEPEVSIQVSSIREFQEQLNIIEPNNPIPVDGKLSNDWRNSKTQTKWDRIVCNQYAAKWDYMYEEIEE